MSPAACSLQLCIGPSQPNGRAQVIEGWDHKLAGLPGHDGTQRTEKNSDNSDPAPGLTSCERSTIRAMLGAGTVASDRAPTHSLWLDPRSEPGWLGSSDQTQLQLTACELTQEQIGVRLERQIFGGLAFSEDHYLQLWRDDLQPGKTCIQWRL